MSALLPLFPLDLVLLPGATLPLHIFEPRYREMIGECHAHKLPFGVVRARENDQLADTGCSAEIVSVANQYPDGRLDIITRGMQRFEIIRVDRDRSFLQAEVLYLHDVPGSAAHDDASRAIALHAEILALAGARPEGETTVEEGLLSFHLASSLPIDLDFKQNLLTMNLESERVQMLISFFETILPNLRRAVHVRKKAGGNGHAL